MGLFDDYVLNMVDPRAKRFPMMLLAEWLPVEA